jgi:uncharacterized protein YjbJ (UPF0337 family)
MSEINEKRPERWTFTEKFLALGFLVTAEFFRAGISVEEIGRKMEGLSAPAPIVREISPQGSRDLAAQIRSMAEIGLPDQVAENPTPEVEISPKEQERRENLEKLGDGIKEWQEELSKALEEREAELRELGELHQRAMESQAQTLQAANDNLEKRLEGSPDKDRLMADFNKAAGKAGAATSKDQAGERAQLEARWQERIEEIRDNADDRANDNVPAQQRQGNPYAPANDNVPPPVKPPDDERNR